MDEIFGRDSNEILVLVTELTMSPDTSEFLSIFKCDAYEEHNRVLLVKDRAKELQEEIKALDELK